MTQYNLYEAKTNLSKIMRILENKEDDCIVISRNNKPILKVTLYNPTNRDNLFGCAADLFDIPENFDDLNLEEDFEEDIL